MADATRRTILLAGAATMTAGAGGPNAFGFTFPAIEGGTLALESYRGKALLVVNTASFCGYTYQYEALQKLHLARQAAGLVVLGVPSQDFNQESADNAKVKQFCEVSFGIDGLRAGLSQGRGAEASAFYRWLKAQTGWETDWNFNKALIGRDAAIIEPYPSSEEPQSPTLTAAIARAPE